MGQVRVKTIPEAAPDVYNPASRKSPGPHPAQSFGSGTHPSTMCSNLDSTSYTTFSQVLNLDPFSPQTSHPVYPTGSEQSHGLHFIQSLGPGALQGALESSIPYAFLDPHILPCLTPAILSIQVYHPLTLRPCHHRTIICCEIEGTAETVEGRYRGILVISLFEIGFLCQSLVADRFI
ncbi:hypothetical protein FB446DRAFT_751601 [Lentinula raphanica]|nr:hypothetical protein FB446DRAFT_751601 [Lentinula raphanica]